MTALERRCPGGHEHVKIEGRLTKPSAVYVPALAQNFGRAFEAALRRKRSKEESEPDVRGVESVLANDLLVRGDWELEFAWHWRRPSHINVLESSAYVSLLKKLTREGGDMRFTTLLLDSRVAKCSHAKGRSSARALQPTLKKGAAWQIAGGLYPALGFAPTRLNTADAPSRGGDVEPQTALAIADVMPASRLQKLHSLSLSRVAASWVRLTLLLSYFVPSESCSPFKPVPACKGDHSWPWIWILAVSQHVGLGLSLLPWGLCIFLGLWICLRCFPASCLGFRWGHLVLCQ